jgi:sugar phosphate permease
MRSAAARGASLFEMKKRAFAEALNSGYSDPEPYRWTIGLLLAVGVLVNYFDRVNLSVSHDALVKSFNITQIAFGQVSAAYSWTYAACQLPTGIMLDNLGVRKVSLVSIFVSGIASLAAAFAPSVLLFFAARLLLGIGEAPTFPASAKAVGGSQRTSARLQLPCSTAQRSWPTPSACRCWDWQTR